MTDDAPLHRDRRRAGSFGAAAEQYDRHRPKYPADLISGVVGRPGVHALDVGAGTGIASRQLAGAGAEVLAVEPDPNMARMAADKGVRVEVASFEEWDPAGRTFDLVVFAQSFHWVEPRGALAKVASILRPGGRLALLWNRITPVRPTLEQFDAAYAGLLDEWKRPSTTIESDDELGPLLAAAGFSAERRRCVEDLHFSTADWVEMVTTYSNVLSLTPGDQAELRSRLQRCIGTMGVAATNDALAVVCTLNQASAAEP
ncbi:methylase involved in ubiquinone/menaquinone biosynthesis [Mycolicibacterium chubuense NBB4]|uniref:Methylase involved in ubiquinone/menaquinone biosynthesis n=1 Tax=Mycolicibacterium chubuense (strain NBB4) TaxID=710421 RepID=I4BDD1_MYCCN|nr:class I SAM-dependent methyltransferase [Mycolicibacterium chubuense]AFM15288.1 methylase involved in ubiquinone/menaquinone biosynthesis [Mycolicibacterium chubuense NBB4]